MAGGAAGSDGSGGDAGGDGGTHAVGGEAGQQAGGAEGRPALTRFQLALGTEFGCAINQPHTIECWGEELLRDVGQTMPPPGNYIQIRATDAMACAFKADGRFDCWGDLVAVSKGTDADDIAIGADHVCVLKDTGSIVCHGKAGNAEVLTQPGPFTRVGAGWGSSCGLGEDGALLCWGGAANRVVTEAPSGTFSELAVGPHHACAIKQDDLSAVCWGAGGADDPNGNDPDQIAFGQAVAPEGRFRALAAGLGHTCGLLEDGTVQCWGAGTEVDQCSNTLQCGQSTPPDDTFVQIAAGTPNSCGIRQDGSLACWGSNTGNRSTPPADFRAF